MDFGNYFFQMETLMRKETTPIVSEMDFGNFIITIQQIPFKKKVIIPMGGKLEIGYIIILMGVSRSKEIAKKDNLSQY